MRLSDKLNNGDFKLSEFVLENLRLKELVIVVEKNKPFYDEVVYFLNKNGYKRIFDFINEKDESKLSAILYKYFNNQFATCLYDGIARPYEDQKSKWFFITWLLRDAPQQRLQPIVASLDHGNPIDNKVWALIRLIMFVSPLFPFPEQWEWPPIAEVMLQRLEGSRRALKGGLFEAIVRTKLTEMFKKIGITLKVTNTEVKIHDETYDVEVIGKSGKILMPVKTRETMGGGHALLFTRDIYKSISVAESHGYTCIPIVIAESWTGDLDALPCEHKVYIPLNPNQVDRIHPILESELYQLKDFFIAIQ